MAKAQILVADSDPDFAAGLTANLESLGYKVTKVVSSPGEALVKAEETQPDLVLLDLGWLQDGRKGKAARQLRKRFPQGLLYLVPDDDRETLKPARITHSFDYLRKAYDSRELETIIDMALFRQKLERKATRSMAARSRKRQEMARRSEKHEAEIEMAAALRRSYEEMEARVQDRTQELAQSNAALQSEVAERLWSEKKLRESEERYRLLVDLSPDAIAVYSQGRLVFINPAGAQLFGAADPWEIMGKPALDLVHPEHREVAKQRLRRLTTEGGRTKSREIKILRRDGQELYVEASAVGITYQGQPAVQVMLRDISRRKEMERRLEHLASFPRLNPNPVLEVDASRNITYANEATFKVLEKLGLENMTRAFLPADLDEIMKTARETGENVFQREVKINGAVFSVAISFAKEFELFRVYTTDITARKQAEIEHQKLLEKLQASEEELQATVEELRVQTQGLQVTNQNLYEAHTALQESQQDLNRAQTVAHIGSWRLDVRNNELLWSDENHRIFGIPKGTPLTYEAFLATVHPEDREYVDRMWTAALRGEPYDIEHRIMVGDTVKWVRERAELEFDASGQLQGGFGTTQDITERKAGEEGLRLALADSRQRQAEIAALLQATRAVLEARTFPEISRSIYDSCKDLIGASSGYIALLSADGTENEVLFLDTGETRCKVDPSLPMPVRGLREEAYRTCRTVYHNDFSGSDYAEFLPQGHVGLDNVLFSPLMVKGEAVGLLGLGNKPGGYTDNDVRLAAGFGKLAALALVNKRAEEERERLIRELETERARLQAIIASAPEAILVADENGHILLTNPAADRLYSHPKGCVQDAPSCALFQFSHADGNTCNPGNQPLLRSAKEGETHRNLEMVIAWPDGQRRDLLVNTAPIKDQQGRSSGAVGLFQDITSLKEGERERQRLMQELEEQRVLLEAVLHQMPAGVVVMDVAGRLILANDQVEQISRQPVPVDMSIDKLRDFKMFHPDGRPYRLEEYSLARALRDGEIIIDEDINYRRRDDSQGILRCSAAPIRDSHGEIMAGVVTFYDITERKHAEMELARRTAEFEAIFNSITDAVVFADPERRVVMVNPAMTDIWGYEPEELYGRDTEFLYAHKTDYQRMGRHCYHTGPAQNHQIFQVHYRRKDGTVFIGETMGSQVWDATGKVLGYVGIHRDITQRKEAEEKIQKLNQELSDRIREVSERTRQLEAANKELEAFSYSVSHDLRTPLRAIEGFARMLQEDYAETLDDEGLRLLEVIRSNTRIMAELIDDLLALSRLGRQEIRAQKIDLGVLAATVFKELRTQAPERQMELVLEPMPPAFGDRSLINQVLINLLGNAIKFTKFRDKAIIEVGGWTEGEENIYFVKDNGVGFDMLYVEKIFGVFQRLHRRKDFEGTGVGLAIVQRILSRHEGRVWATGKVDNGAVFYFALPRKGGER